MQITTSEGTTVALHDLGGTGEPLLVCHATGFLGEAYRPLAAELRARHHVWAVDIRGHGDSPPPADGNFDWRRSANDLLAAAQAIAARPLHGFGHSMGGALTLFVEATYPGTFATAFAYEPILPPPAGPGASMGNPLAASARRRREAFPSREAALYRYASRAPLDVFQAAALHAYVEHGFADLDDGTVRLKCRPESEARTFESAGIGPAEVQSVAIPVVVAAGDAEASGPALFAPAVADAIASARFLPYPHLGHFGPFQDPASIARDIVELTGAT